MILLGHETTAFERYVKARGRSVVDVGANYGEYTDKLLDGGARRVVAVEPGPALARNLRARYAYALPSGRMTVVQKGLSDREGLLEEVCFHNCWSLARPGQYADKHGLSQLSPEAERVEGEGVFDVELTTLDAIVRSERLDDLAFVKIDVDGYEPKVLRGAEHVLSVLRPPIMIELSAMIVEMGESVLAMVWNVRAHDYVFVSSRGEVATEAEVMEQFPYHTSFDVFLVPREALAGTA